MKLDVGIPAGSRQRLFLDNLNALFRRIVQNSQGSAKFNPDGSFISTVSGMFRFADKEASLTMTITRIADGTLEAIEVSANDKSIADAEWKDQTHSLIEQALAATIAERTKEYFRRRYYNYIGPQMDGEYWLPGFRFAPAYPDDPEPSLLNAERVVVLDMNVRAVDEIHANSVASEIAARNAARLSLLLDVGLHETPSEMRWVQIRGTGQQTTESRRLALGFIPTLPSAQMMPKKDELCKRGTYSTKLTDMFHYAGQMLSLPKESRKILRGVENVVPMIGDAFDRCSRMYRLALLIGSVSTSASLAYRVAAVEAIVQANHDYTSFSDFILKNVPDRPKLKEAIDYLYGSARSAHFHAGEFVLGEYSPRPYFNVLIDSGDVERFDLQFAGYRMTREAIIRWIASSLPELAETES